VSSRRRRRTLLLPREVPALAEMIRSGSSWVLQGPGSAACRGQCSMRPGDTQLQSCGGTANLLAAHNAAGSAGCSKSTSKNIVWRFNKQLAAALCWNEPGTDQLCS
jgi:hypothetical protein